MRSPSTAIIAGTALLCSATLTMAQQEHRGPGGPGGQGGPPAGASPGGPPAGRSGPSGGGAPERAAPPSRGPAIERGLGQAEPRGRDTGPKVQQGKERPAARPSERDRNRAEQGQKRDRAVEKGPERQKGPEQKGTEQKRPEKAPRATGREQQPDRLKEAERGRNDQQAQRREEVRTARSKLSSEQQARLRTSFDVSRGRATNVRFDVRVGSRIPRRIRLFVIPVAVFSIVPAYTYYRYVVLEDHVCIVDPDTYEIVDVIDESPYPATSRPHVATLHLSSSERALVLDSISFDFPPADVRIRLALGAEVPRRAELHSFPNVVLDRVPQLRDFRFVVVERDVVVVDPRDRGVAMVIER